MPNILVPIDFSRCTFDVLNQATSLARAYDATIELLHVIEIPVEVPIETTFTPIYDPVPRTAIDHLTQSAEANLAPLQDFLLERGLSVKTTIKVGAVNTEILEAAREQDPLFLVMGTHGRKGFGRLVLGSVAEAVLRNAPCPVVITRFQHKDGCPTRSCTWCADGMTPAQQDVDALVLG